MVIAHASQGQEARIEKRYGQFDFVCSCTQHRFNSIYFPVRDKILQYEIRFEQNYCIFNRDSEHAVLSGHSHIP